MDRLQTMQKELEKCPQLRLEDVKALREWMNSQPHFPNTDDVPDVFLSCFLRRRYYSLEMAKQTIDKCITFRTHEPGLCQNRSTTSPQMRTNFDSQYLYFSDQLDPEGNVVFFHCFHDHDASKFDFNATIKRFIMLVEAWVMENGSANGITYVFDHKVYSLAHLLRIPPTEVKKASYFNKEGAPMSIKNIYFINTTPLTQKLMEFLQPMLDVEIFKKVKMFKASQMDEFYRYIPKEIVPNDYGGSAGTFKQLHGFGFYQN